MSRQSPTSLSVDAEAILLYLLTTRQGSERTRRAIREACQLSDANRAESALRELLAGRFITDLGDNCYELTQSGYHRARSLQPEAQPRVTNYNSVTQHIDSVSGGHVIGLQENHTLSVRDSHLTHLPTHDQDSDTAKAAAMGQTLNRLEHKLPTFAAHPLRTDAAPAGDGGTPVHPGNRNMMTAVRYLLAFEIPRDALPLPVMHGDVIGRSRHATINLQHDEFISSRHVRFEIKRDKVSPVFNLYIEDLGSRNGTVVDDMLLGEGLHQLFHGSRIRVGNTVLIVVQIPF